MTDTTPSPTAPARSESGRRVSATKHSAEVWVLVDPVQDYEETMVILGVYGSLSAAKAALPRLRRRKTSEGGRYDPEYGDDQRDTEARHYRGDELVQTVAYSPKTGWRS